MSFARIGFDRFIKLSLLTNEIMGDSKNTSLKWTGAKARLQIVIELEKRIFSLDVPIF
jgi:hypothetical protein